MQTQSFYNTAQTTGNIQEQESQISFSRKTPEKASPVLGSDPLEQWNQDNSVSGWWEEKSMERKRNRSRSKAHHIIVEAVLWHGHVWLLWNKFTSVYWWCDCWQKWQVEFWSVNVCTVYPHSVKCYKIDGALQCRWITTLNMLWKLLKTFWRQENEIFSNGQLRFLISIEHVSVTDEETEGRKAHKQAATKAGYSEGLAKWKTGTDRKTFSSKF